MCFSCVATEARLPPRVRRPSPDVSASPAADDDSAAGTAGVAVGWSAGDPARVTLFERQLSRFGRSLVAALAAAPDRLTVAAITAQLDWPAGVTVDMALREVTDLSDAGRRTPAVLSMFDGGTPVLALDPNYARARSSTFGSARRENPHR